MFLASWVAGISQQRTEAEEDIYFTAKADSNKDGKVTGADVVYMASAIAGIPGYEITGSITNPRQYWEDQPNDQSNDKSDDQNDN